MKTYTDRLILKKTNPQLTPMLEELDYIESMVKVHFSDIQLLVFTKEIVANPHLVQILLPSNVEDEIEYPDEVIAWLQAKVASIDFSPDDRQSVKVFVPTGFKQPRLMEAQDVILGGIATICPVATDDRENNAYGLINGGGVVARKIKDMKGHIVWTNVEHGAIYDYEPNNRVVISGVKDTATLMKDLPVGTNVVNVDDTLPSIVAKQGKKFTTMSNGRKFPKYVEFKGDIVDA